MTVLPELILVLNAGSSSVKFCIFSSQEEPELMVRGQLDGLNSQPRMTVRDSAGRPLEIGQWPPTRESPHALAPTHLQSVQAILDWTQQHFQGRPITAVGHRVVHGGSTFNHPVIIDEKVLDQLQALDSLAPLHQPHHLSAIESVAQTLPQTPQVACFDTAFHNTQSMVERMYALPRRFFDQGVMRYGFHGLSYEYIAGKLVELDPHHAKGRVVVAHLGSGCSMCALQNGKSRATSMGFSTLDGLPMATRTGSIDPGVLLYLQQVHSLSVQQLQRLLYEESGLLGISGVSGDMRELLRLESSHAGAALAIKYFIYRIRRELGSLVSLLGGLDCLVFCGGIGESSAVIRERICRELSWMGLQISPSCNEKGAGAVHSQGSPIEIWVIPTHEELMIARHTVKLLARKRKSLGS